MTSWNTFGIVAYVIRDVLPQADGQRRIIAFYLTQGQDALDKILATLARIDQLDHDWAELFAVDYTILADKLNKLEEALHRLTR